MDFYFCTACLAVTLGGVPKNYPVDAFGKCFVFPFLCKLNESSAARTMTSYLKTTVAIMERPNNLWEDGTGLRSGACIEMYSAGLQYSIV